MRYFKLNDWLHRPENMLFLFLLRAGAPVLSSVAIGMSLIWYVQSGQHKAAPLAVFLGIMILAMNIAVQGHPLAKIGGASLAILLYSQIILANIAPPYTIGATWHSSEILPSRKSSSEGANERKDRANSLTIPLLIAVLAFLLGLRFSVPIRIISQHETLK